MSTEMNLRELHGEQMGAEGLDETVSGGELFIRDLASTSTLSPARVASAEYSDDDYDDEDDDGMVTTQMLGEEGRGDDEDEPERDSREDSVITTQALGEEGRGGDL